MKNILRASCAAVFLIGLLVFALPQTSSHQQFSSRSPDDIEPAQSFVMTLVQYRVSQDGARTVLTTSTINQKANGEARNVCHGADGRLTIYATLADGVYTKGDGSNALIYESPRKTEEMLEFYRSPRSLSNAPNLVRTDKIAGLQVYVLRQETANPDTPIEWVEQSYSPKTGVTWLRMVVHFRDGSEVTSEATRLEFVEVPDALNDDLKDLPISNLEEKRLKQSQNRNNL